MPQTNYSIRFATQADVPLLLCFIRELAEYEQMLDNVVATEEILQDWMFVQHRAQAIIAERDGEPLGFALYFYNFSTFLGRAGIYLEDLYVRPPARGLGLGKALLKELARIAVKEGCGRLEWACLDWNKPSIEFYLSLGAQPQEEWTTYRLQGDTLTALAQS